MFFNSIKEINRLLSKGLFLIQLKKNRLRKEINRLLGKVMSNIYLKVTIETFSKLRISEFKNLVTRPILGSSNSPRYH